MMSLSPLKASLNRWQLLVTTVILSLLLLPALGRPGLLDPWEMDRAAVGRHMAAPPRVVIVEAGTGALLTQIDKQLQAQFVLAHPFEQRDTTAVSAMQQAVTRATRQVSHALVVDVDAVLGEARTDADKRVEVLAGQLATIEGANRGTPTLLVSKRAGAELENLHKNLALGRARAALISYKTSIFAGLFSDDRVAFLLASAHAADDTVLQADAVAAALKQRTPSPWSLPVHMRDNQSVTAPWLDAALTGLSLKILGPSEFAARFPAALLAILLGLVVVVAARRLWGSTEAWLVLLVYATLPMTFGLGRVLTFEATAPLGIALCTLGLAQGFLRRGWLWLGWFILGFAILLLGRGMAGAGIACGIAGLALLALGPQPAAIAATLLAGLATAVAANWVYNGNPDDMFLRSLRFTQWPFGGGPDMVHRDFAWFVGQAGFGLFPWGAPFVVGLARLLGTPNAAEPSDNAEQDAIRQRVSAVLLIGVLVPFCIDALLIKKYNHFVIPAAPLAAVVTGVMLADLLRGKLKGRVLAVFIALATLLLHREIGKGADAVTRFIAFDPPLGGTDFPWPADLLMPRSLRAVALLSVLGFALGRAEPLASLRATVAKLRQPRAAAWALGLVGMVWILDALISLGTKLDVLLKSNAITSGYNYDRIWVELQGRRPEVIAGATVFALTLAMAAAATLLPRGEMTRHFLVRLPLKISRIFSALPVAIAAVAVGAATVLFAGLAKYAELHAGDWGGAFAAGLADSAFYVPLLAAIVALALRKWLQRFVPAQDNLFAPLARGLATRTPLIVALLMFAALSGVGIGASQVAGTWSYTYLGGIWLWSLASMLAIWAVAQEDAGAYGWPLLVIGKIVAAPVFMVFALRYIQEVQPLTDALKYLAHVLLTAPDSGMLIGVAIALLINRLALRIRLLDRLMGLVINGVAKLEQPRIAAAALGFAAFVFSAGYAYSLLPALSVHYSQKHLLVKIADAGGAGKDLTGTPRTFTHGSAKSANDNNFYTATMPLIEDRQAVLNLLAARNVATRITDNSEGGLARTIVLPGFAAAVDANKDGKRDQNAWFGVATKSDGLQVGATDAKWTPHAWQGATFYPPTGDAVQVLDNTADSLTLAAKVDVTADDPTKGAFTLDKWANGPPEHEKFAAQEASSRFVVVPKDGFSELNHAYRQAFAGQHIAVLDAASSRLVLATNRLPAGAVDQNWLRKAILSQAEFDKLSGVRKMAANFDNQIALIGYKLAEPSVARSQKYKLTLYWKVLKQVPTSWKLFMHPHPLNLDRWPLTDPDPSEEEGSKPCGGCFQTNHWMVGDIIADSFEQEVPLGTQSGPNEIILGWYNPGSDTRMPLLSASGEGVIKHNDNRVTIGQLQVR